MIKSIIFDISGVVTFDNYHQIYANFAERVGLPPEFISGFFKENWNNLLMGHISLEKIFETFRNKGVNTEADLKTIWLEEALKIRKVNTEMVDIISKLRKNYTVGALSNLTPPRKMVDEALKIYEHFDFVVLSCVEKIKKPDSKFYQLALQKANCSPAEAVFVDDNERNVIAARVLGLNDILFVDNKKLLTDFNNLGIVI
ncbi:MAG: HAD family phosphatase [Patescibacteria group bacterium]|nr:HAD family phosphatase [Patescibacteria group bacterium]